jgi:pimeloyl-ACP methyl ester carboxylesterase
MGNGVSSGMEIFEAGELEAELKRLGGAGDSSVKKLLGSGYRDVVGLVIRPKRAEYALADLGAPSYSLAASDDPAASPSSAKRVVRRSDFEVLNDRTLKLVCSHWQLYEGDDEDSEPSAAPCLVYLHSNIGSRVDSRRVRDHALRRGMSVLAFDFCGSGKSDGVYVTMGWNEARDLNAVLQAVESSPSVMAFVIYAHSMGTFPAIVNVAARSLVAVNKKTQAKLDALPQELRPANVNQLGKPIKGLVIDGGYATMAQANEGMLRTMQNEGFPLPKSVMKLALAAINQSVKKRTEVDMDQLRPVDFVPACTIPALFLAGKDDKYISPEQSDDLASKYPGPATVLKVEGEHYDPRDSQVYSDAVDFLFGALHSSPNNADRN